MAEKIPLKYHFNGSDTDGLSEFAPTDTIPESNLPAGMAAETTGTIGTLINGAGSKNPPVDADKVGYSNSEAGNILVQSTWTQIKAFLKTYFDTLYNLYVHPNHSGEVTSNADGAQTIANAAVTLAKMANLAQDTVIGRKTASTGVPEALSASDLRTLLNVANGSQANASGGTLTSELDLGENAGLVLDAALSVDGKYCGITEAGVGGATLAFGQLCYFQASDSRWELVDANVSAGYDKKLGICVLAAANDGSATKMLLIGKIRADAQFPTLVKGSAVYMGETAGEIVTDQPSTSDVAIRIIGFGNTIDELWFNPENSYMVHA
jgi:hypothetical protein